MPLSKDKEPSWQEQYEDQQEYRRQMDEKLNKLIEHTTPKEPAPPNPTPPNPTPAEKPAKPKWLTLQ